MKDPLVPLNTRVRKYAHKRKVARLAKAVSEKPSEIVRRAIEAYDPKGSESKFVNDLIAKA